MLQPEHFLHPGNTKSGAVFSPCEKYRYTLWRRWQFIDPDPNRLWCAFIGLNPSTADETQDDPTVRRCIRFAKSWGYAGMFMLNLFAWRDTDPHAMKSILVDPVGRENDKAIETICEISQRVVCCWGNHGTHQQRSQAVRRFILSNVLNKCVVFGFNRNGEPKHPLYVAANTEPVYLSAETNPHGDR